MARSMDAGMPGAGAILSGTGALMRAVGLAALIGALGVQALPGRALAQAGGQSGDQAEALNSAEAVALRPEVVALMQTMRIGDIVALLREEGIDYGRTLETDMFPGAGGAGWQATVGLIYDGARMEAAFGAALNAALDGQGEATAAAQSFFGSALGQKVLGLEIEARRALLDQAVEDAAKLAWEDMAAEDGARVALLEEFVAANDLVESNVMGALNSNLAFYRGMAEGGAFGDEMTEDQMLSDTWAQEGEIRASTEGWIFPYLALAYGPLSDAELQDYIDFSRSAAGQTLNSALFAAFDDVFTPVSRALGLAVARQLQGQDI